VAKYRISRVYGEIRRNWFFSNFDRTFLETVKRPLARVLCIDRGSGLLANGVEKSEIRPSVFGVQWVKIGQNANFQTKNAHFQTPISLPIGGRSPPFKNRLCYGPKPYNRQGSFRGSVPRKGVYPTPNVPHPQICDFPNFDRPFLETVKSDFAQIFGSYKRP